MSAAPGLRRGLAVLALLAFVVAGCASRVSLKNFQRLDEGMTMDEVIAILGEPSDSSSLGVGPVSGTTATWESDEAVIRIQFLNDKVRLKSFDRKTAAERGDE